MIQINRVYEIKILCECGEELEADADIICDNSVEITVINCPQCKRGHIAEGKAQEIACPTKGF